ncbi:MAG: GNAT family N-acetyltransferase [Bacteroidota bacterium]
MINIYTASADNIPELINVRLEYLREDFAEMTEADEKTVVAQLNEYFPRHIGGNDFLAILAEDNGSIVASAFLLVSEKPANPFFYTGITGTILNVYTAPEYRRKGIATRVINALLDEARRMNISVVDLLATDDGKPLYETLGFTIPSNTYMRMQL